MVGIGGIAAGGLVPTAKRLSIETGFAPLGRALLEISANPGLHFCKL